MIQPSDAQVNHHHNQCLLPALVHCHKLQVCPATGALIPWVCHHDSGSQPWLCPKNTQIQISIIANLDTKASPGIIPCCFHKFSLQFTGPTSEYRIGVAYTGTVSVAASSLRSENWSLSLGRNTEILQVSAAGDRTEYPLFKRGLREAGRQRSSDLPICG